MLPSGSQGFRFESYRWNQPGSLSQAFNELSGDLRIKLDKCSGKYQVNEVVCSSAKSVIKKNSSSEHSQKQPSRGVLIKRVF